MQLVGYQSCMDCSLDYPIYRNNRWYVTPNADISAEEVMQKALEFDFNKYKKPYEKTFEAKFMEMTTNELGNLILPCAAEVVILQLRKFIGVLAINSMFLNKLNSSELNIDNIYNTCFFEKLEYYICNNKLYFENIYSPSTIIDSAWKLLIQNSKIYREFCYELCGAFIDRVEPQSNQIKDNKYTIKYIWMHQFFLDYNNYFKKYDPLHESFYNPNYLLFVVKHFVKIKKKYLSSIINYIDEKVIDLDIDQERTDKIFNLCNKIHCKIFINNTDAISISKADNELILNSILNPEKYSSYPLVFIQLLTTDFNRNLLSSFKQVYCLRNSDVILIMVEYLKFLTICKIYNENFSPSLWVDQFWHHHMSYDTKYYREFCENIFGVDVDHQEYNPQSMSQEEKFILVCKSKRFEDVYIECFGESPPKCIWPELTLGSWEAKDENFVSINIYKTVLMKLFIK